MELETWDHYRFSAITCSWPLKIENKENDIYICMHAPTPTYNLGSEQRYIYIFSCNFWPSKDSYHQSQIIWFRNIDKDLKIIIMFSWIWSYEKIVFCWNFCRPRERYTSKTFSLDRGKRSDIHCSRTAMISIYGLHKYALSRVSAPFRSPRT